MNLIVNKHQNYQSSLPRTSMCCTVALQKSMGDHLDVRGFETFFGQLFVSVNVMCQINERFGGNPS